MRKLLVGVIVFFIITGAVAAIYSFRHREDNIETNVSQSDDDLYPESLRPSSVKEEDVESGETPGTQELENEEGAEGELVSDEAFEEFEIEEESPENPVEGAPPEGATPEATPEAPAAENIPAQPPVAPGTPIEISEYRVRLRARPSEDGVVLAICKEGDTGTLTTYGEDWSTIKIGGREGYIHNSCWRVVSAM